MSKMSNNRLLSLDVLRGITIAGMILVNNPGSWSYIYAPFGHAAWNGLTPTDLVFPFFMFIMGISTYMSLRKYNFEYSHSTLAKVVKRTIIIFAIGIGVAWFGLFCRTWNSLSGDDISFFARLGESMWTFERIRIMGVMQRLALCYGVSSIVALTVKHKYIPYIVAATLVGYFVVLLGGDGFQDSATNILAIVDEALLGRVHMYGGGAIDPEGLLSTIPSIAQVLIGFCVGKLLVEAKDVNTKMEQLFIVGTILTFVGFLLSYGCPINKTIWSPTFVLVTCGLASSLLAILVWIIDIKGYKKWSRCFESFGVNPLFIYVMGAFFTILFINILIPYDGGVISLSGFVYRIVLQPILGNYPASLVYAILFVGVNWFIGNILYKRKIYIKV